MDQQGETEAGVSGNAPALRSLCRPSQRARLFTTRKRAAVLPAAAVRPTGEAAGGLCIGRSCTDTSGLGAATNKQRRV